MAIRMGWMAGWPYWMGYRAIRPSWIIAKLGQCLEEWFSPLDFHGLP
jgi:hypothetical protein